MEHGRTRCGTGRKRAEEELKCGEGSNVVMTMEGKGTAEEHERGVGVRQGSNRE